MRGESLGPLHGVPVSIKDLVITKGMRTMRGSKLYEQDVPTEDAPVVERLKAAGAIILGKTTTPEFGFKGVTDSLVTGITRNPWHLDRTPGGSSGGAGWPWPPAWAHWRWAPMAAGRFGSQQLLRHLRLESPGG